MEKTDFKLNNNRFSVKKTAKLVSYIFDGSVLALPLFLSIYFEEKTRLAETLPSLFISIFFLALIPYMLIFCLYKCGKICDLHMPKRKERIIPLIFINSIAISGFFLLWLVPATLLLKTVYTIYIAGLITLSIVSLFWKISFHTSYVTIFAIIFITVYGKWGFITLLLLPLMIWARTELKRHTLAQAVSGVIATSIISFTLLIINGYSTALHAAFRDAALLLLFLSHYINNSIFFNKIEFALVLLLALIIFFIYKSYQSKNLNYYLQKYGLI